MKNNAIINTRLEDLLNVMDARAYIDIFEQVGEYQELLRSNKIYNLISNQEFIGKYGACKVIGLSVTLAVTSILIEEA